MRNGNSKLERIYLTQKKTTIGRRPECDIVLESKKISKKQAIIRKDTRSSYSIESTTASGVKVNDQKMKKSERLNLRDGDIVAFGDKSTYWRFEYSTEDEKDEEIEDEDSEGSDDNDEWTPVQVVDRTKQIINYNTHPPPKARRKRCDWCERMVSPDYYIQHQLKHWSEDQEILFFQEDKLVSKVGQETSV